MTETNTATTVEATEKFTRATLVSTVAGKCELTKSKTAEIVAEVYDTIREAVLAGNSVQIPGLGTLKLRKVEERTYNTPLTEGATTVPAHYKPVLKTSVKLGAE